MKIVELQADEFDVFARDYPYGNFYQTKQYGMLMNRHQFNDYYLGLEDENGKIIAGTLILVRRGSLGFKWGYCPRGFLIDFKNENLVENFTNLLKEYLKKRNFMYIKIDPILIYQSHNNEGEITPQVDNTNIYNKLVELGYEHSGFNLNFENLKPRWNAVSIFEPTDNIFTMYSKEKRNKIRKAYKLGIEILKGNAEDIRMFYDFIKDKHSRKFNYYLDMYEIFGKDNMFDIYFSNLNTAKFVEQAKGLYEKEEQNNNEINEELLENLNSNNRNNILKRKTHSDMLLNTYKQNMINATNIYKQFPAGRVIGTCAVIKYRKEIFFLIYGYEQNYRSYCPMHLMIYQLMDKFQKEGYTKFNLNGISGDFSSLSNYTNLTKFKLGFNSHIEEYMGEFTITISKGKRNIHERISAILDWLNTPVI